jgi:hypothetical protein
VGSNDARHPGIEGRPFPLEHKDRANYKYGLHQLANSQTLMVHAGAI